MPKKIKAPAVPAVAPAALKDFDINVPAKAPSSKKSSVPVQPAPASVVGKYAEYVGLAAQAKEIEGRMNEIRPELEQASVPVIVQRNCNVGPTSSINFEDGDVVCQFQFRNQYRTVAPDLVALDGELLKFFDEVNAADPSKVRDLNSYVQKAVVAKWDNAALMDANGNFDLSRYKAFAGALQAVADQLGVPNPLSQGVVVSVKPDFHERRFKDFDVDQNLRLTELVKNTVSFQKARSE